MPLSILAVLATLIGGCATWKSPADWFGGDPPADTAGTADTAATTPYYTGVPGMKVYAEPRYSSSYVTALQMHQKVYRSKLEGGFAYVEVDGGGYAGWVENSKLIWRLPKAAAPKNNPMAGAASTQTAPAAAPAPAAPAAEPEPPPTSPGGSLIEPAAAAAEEMPPPAKAEPDDDQDADPSIFSPF